MIMYVRNVAASCQDTNVTQSTVKHFKASHKKLTKTHWNVWTKTK